MSIFDKFKKLGKKKGKEKETDMWDDEDEYSVAEFETEEEPEDEVEEVDEDEVEEVDEVESADGGVKVNYRGDLLNPSRKDKQEVYDRILQNTTNAELVEIDKSLKTSVTQYETFEDLEGKGISLMVLVALGFITEEEISGYRAYKEQGIDTTQFLTPEELTKPTDMDYAQEVFNASVALPETYGEETSVRPVEEPEYVPVEPVEDDEPEEDELELDTEPEQVEQAEEMGDSELEQDEEEEKEIIGAIPVELSALSRLKNIRVEQKEETQETDVEVEGTQPDAEVEPKPPLPPVEEIVVEEERVRQVYVVAEKMTLPEYEGYQFHDVVTFDGIRKYTASKNNLLVITSDIPEELHDGFGDWLTGIAEDGDKYRMVTTISDPVNHPNIEMEIELTKEGLDAYFEECTDDLYVSVESGSFADMELLWGN